MRDASPESVSPGTTVVACLVLLSALAYFAFSASVRTILNEWSYLQFVLTSLLHEPHARVFAFDLSPSLEAVTTFAAYAGSCVGVGVLVSRRLAGSQAATPMAWIFGLAAAVVPTLVIALIWWPDGGGHLTNQTVCLAQGVCVAAVWWITRRASHPDSSASNAAHATHQAARAGADDPLPGWLRAGLALAGVYALTILISGFSGIYGYDSYSDHLARPARWLSLGRLERGLPEEVVEFYPGNFELLVRWTLSLGTDRLAFLLAFGSSAASVWVVFRIARTLGQSRVAATMAALGAASLQALAYQSMIVYSDSYTALCLLLATWLLVVWVREGAKDRASVAGFGLALGLALGAKYSAGPPVIVLGLVWLWHAWRASWDVGSDGLDRLNWGRLATQSVVLGGSALPPMLYWYVRNVVEQGNPLYPLSVAGLPGLNIGALLANVPGPKSALERLTWPWTEIGHISGYETGLGPLVASVVVVAVCAVPFARRRLGGGTLLTWIVLIGASIAWWRTGVLVPRYGFFPLLLSFVFVGALWTAYPSRVLAAVYGVGVGATMFAVGHQMLGGAGYNELLFDPGPRVPAIINELPPSRILNGAGQPSGYHARGLDQRHRVITPFSGGLVADVRRFGVDYLLIPQSREAEFVGPLGLELMGRWEKEGQPPTSLWKVPAEVPAQEPFGR